jgi:hypothetical protein
MRFENVADPTVTDMKVVDVRGVHLLRHKNSRICEDKQTWTWRWEYTVYLWNANIAVAM